MHTVRAWLCSVLLASLSAFGCAPALTQLIVVVDTDLAIPGDLDEVRITITGPDGTVEVETERLSSRDRLPLTLTVVVGEATPLRAIDVLVEGLRAGTVRIDRHARATPVRGESRVLSLSLLSTCLGVECGVPTLSCGEGGCNTVSVGMLPPWTGVIPRLDGGPDAASIDAGPPDGPLPDARDAGPVDGGPPDAAPGDAGPPCMDDGDCDDGIACTVDRCAAGGCERTPDDSLCDDSNVCTDDRCVAGAGCTPMPNTVACSDATFCNGFDTCSGGSCAAHDGNPCVGSTICDEAGDRCTGCATASDCPDPSVGAFGACDYVDGCDQSASRTRTVRAYACTAGACVPSDSTESEACSRSTEGTSCGMGSCGGFGACGFADGCAESGTATRTCTDLVCSMGTCRGNTRSETMPCSRSTSGMMCSASTCGAYGACDYTDACDQSASQSRTCNDFACGGGTCGSTPRTESTGCSRSTDGMSCGAGRVCMAGSCSACVLSLSGSFGTVGGTSDFIRVDGAGSSLTFVDYDGSSGSISAPGVTFSGSVAMPIALWQVHASGNTLRLVDWDGTTMGTITLAGATATGTHAPPCVPSKFGCFPPYVQRVVGVTGGLQFFDSQGGATTINFACP